MSEAQASGAGDVWGLRYLNVLLPTVPTTVTASSPRVPVPLTV
ncbi:hypothetical protein [Deinococcus reticulitermitis]|nr:hypothetical protein [Deinococcus reticulitermitis]